MKVLIIYDEKHFLLDQVSHHIQALGHKVEFVQFSAFSWLTSSLPPLSEFDAIYFDRPAEASCFFWQQTLLLSAHKDQQKIHNNPLSYAVFRNKAAGTLWLKENGFPTPETIISQSVDSALHLLNQTQWDKVILKPIYGHSGLGICGFKKREVTLKASQTLEQAIHHSGLIYLQEFIATEPVRDLRIDIVGENIVSSYFRNKVGYEEYPVCNISRGAVQEPTLVPPEIASEARRLMKLSGLSFAGIDLIWHQQKDRYEWVEVNPEPNACEWQPEFPLEIAKYIVSNSLASKTERIAYDQR